MRQDCRKKSGRVVAVVGLLLFLENRISCPLMKRNISGISLFSFFFSYAVSYCAIWWRRHTRPNFFQRSSRIRVNLLLYESKTTNKRQQNDWRAKKNLDGYIMYYLGLWAVILAVLFLPWCLVCLATFTRFLPPSVRRDVKGLSELLLLRLLLLLLRHSPAQEWKMPSRLLKTICHLQSQKRRLDNSLKRRCRGRQLKYSISWTS